MKIVMFISKGLLTTVLSMTFFTNSFSQGFKVKEFKQIINDGSAFHAPMDVDGHPCGLVKVSTDDEELKFKGDIVGKIENRTNEYWVFMAQGSKSLNILHPNFLPITVDFSSFGIDEVASKATYILTLSEQKFKKEKCGLVTTVKPETASLFINDVLIENISGNGLYQLYLPKGDYVCRVEQKGYRPNVQAVTIGKGTQNMNVELESLMAELEVKCKTSTAEIYVDGEKKGNGSWKGPLYAGDHKVEARQQNFESSSQNIIIAEKESRTLVIPELKRSMGKVRITTNPSGMPVIVDGKDVGISPCTVEVESGKHYVSCTSYGVEPIRSNIEVNGGNIINVELPIQYADDVWKDYYERAYNGSLKDVLSLACLGGLKGNYQEALFWINRHPQGDKAVKYWQEYGAQTEMKYWECDWIQIYSEVGNPEKALEIYPIWKEREENNGGIFLSELEMKYIGDGFLKKKEIDKAIRCYEKSGKEGYEGLGDCYMAKGNKQLAASYYRKCLNLDYYDDKKGVEKKLKELGY